MILDILPTTRPDPQAPETRGESEVGGAELPEGDPTFELAHNPPPDEVELGQSAVVRLDQSENENTNFPQTMLTFQTPDTREEGVVVGAEEPGGDPTLKLGHNPPPVDLELGHPDNEKIPEQNIICQQKPIGGDTPQPSPVHGKGLLEANLMILDILPTNRPVPQALETRGEGEVVVAEEPRGDPPFEQVHNPPSVDLELGYLEIENTNFPQTMLTFLELSQGRMEELTSL